MPLKDPIARAAWDKQYNKKNRVKRNAYQKQYQKDHPEERKEAHHKWYMKNIEKKAVYNKKYRKENSEYFAVYKKQYSKDHPEVDLRAQRKLRIKSGIPSYNLIAWTKVIRKGKNCSYCDSDKDLHSHHLLSKARYPGLALSENNGIPLCVTCHREHHSMNGVTA
jgi:5-methylcytosine-specific restriction endonuclease McrA